MANTTNTVGKYILDRLWQLGVRDVFGVPGDFVIRFCQQVEQSPLRWVGTCNELDASYAGDGYARLRGLAAVVTTYGVGELSAVNGIAGAFAERVPVVHIVGAPKREQISARLELHHTLGRDADVARAMMSHVTVASAWLADPARAPADVDAALAACVAERGPVYICVPNDVFDAPCCETPAEPLRAPAPRADQDSLREALEDALGIVASAKSPVIIADVGILWGGAQAELLELVEASGIPFVTTIMSKAVAAETHALFAGVYQGRRSREAVWRRVESADCVLGLGVLETDLSTGGFTVAVARSRLVSASENGHVGVRHHFYRHVPLRAFLSALTEALRARGPPRDPETLDFVPAVRAALHAPLKEPAFEAERALTASKLFDRLARFLPDNCVYVSDTGVASFESAELVLPVGATYVAQSYYASIGYSVGAAVGAAVADPSRRVVLVVGDGAFQMTAQEISTALRLGLSITVVLLNNKGYTIERLIREGAFNDVQNWRYARLPATFGGPDVGEVVKTEGQLEGALERCAARTGVSFVEVLLDKMDVPASLASAGKYMQ